MLRLNFELSWPIKQKNTPNHSFGDFCRTYKLTNRKYFEIQCARFYNDFTLLAFDLDASIWGRDHAGVRLEFTLLGYTMILQVYDIRHWNYEENRWMTDAETEEETREWEEYERARQERNVWLNDSPRGKEII
jgi:hypothetical protein